MPNVLRVPQSYAANQMYSRVKDAASLIGEEFIALAMYHANTDENDIPRCVCYNPVYGQNQSIDCPYCYGTTFAGGIREVWRTWGIATDQNEDEKKAKTGVWQKEDRHVQMEPWPNLTQNDYIVRVSQWDVARQWPLVIGQRYLITNVQSVSVRTGNRFAGAVEDQIAQKIDISVLPANHPIYQFEVKMGVTFLRYDGQPR